MKFCLHLLSILAAIVATTTIIAPARADGLLPEVEVPSWLEPYKKQLWNPSGLATLAFLAITGGILLSSDRKPKKGIMANARWAGKSEKLAARKVAIKQINERQKDGLTTWINTPIITSLRKPVIKKGEVVKRYHINPQKHTVFIPDGQRGTMVCGAPGSGKTFSVIDPMIRSVIDQGFPICLYDFKFPGGQAGTKAMMCGSLLPASRVPSPVTS
jgi:hypothetical protein